MAVTADKHSSLRAHCYRTFSLVAMLQIFLYAYQLTCPYILARAHFMAYNDTPGLSSKGNDHTMDPKRPVYLYT